MPNSKDNQHCFNCASFQPYLPGQQPAKNNGECRFEPQVGVLEYSITPTKFNQFWPYINDGDNFWCSKWKMSQLDEIVPASSPTPGVFPDDWGAFRGTPWNARESLNQSCWNCNHFQRDYSLPLQPGQNTGQCRKTSPPAVLNLVVAGVPPTDDLLESLKFSYEGSDYFCSCWEHARGDVPDDPGPPS